jgi:anti-sigma factor RsiW
MDCRAFETNLARYEYDQLAPAERGEFEAHAATCAACGPTFDGYQRSTCAWIAEFLADYFEGGLAPGEARVFDWHLAVCEECRLYLRQYQATLRAARAVSEVELPVPPRLVAAILAARPR